MRNQATKMQATVTSRRVLKGLLDDSVLGQLILLDSLVNANYVLPYNTASANVQVTDFRVAHETLG